MASVKFSQSHEWISVDGDTAVVGITDYAQKQLGDVVFVELPDVGTTVDTGDEVAVVESVKAASEIYSPVSGEVTEANGALEDEPSKINAAAESDGWLFKIKLTDPSAVDALMDKAAYAKYVEGLD